MNELLKPIRIGKMTVKNRIVMGPMNTNFSSETGAVTSQMQAYFTERAKYGTGLIVAESASVVPSPVNHGVQPLMTDDKYIPGWSNLVDGIHAYGAKVSIELTHYGSEGTIGNRVSCWDISHYGEKVRILTVDEIRDIQKAFAEAALRAKMAGFDAVTLHAAHGYLLAEFLSPLYNKRTDQYGGAVENRARMLTETISCCREALGPGFPLIVRISADEYVKGGRQVEESAVIARIIERAGADAIDITACVPNTYIFSIRPNNIGLEEGFLASASKKIKEAVTIPVICAGAMREPDKMEEIIKSGSADMITLGRALLADEKFCQKIYENRTEDIRRCLSCMDCLATLNSGKSLRCAINPRTGREYLIGEPTKADMRRRIAVIGAGPAGMQAALTAAKRGHEVTLYEKEGKLGGTVVAAACPPGKDRLSDLIHWYERELRKNRVEIRLGCDVDRKMLVKLQMEKDAIIMATGADYLKSISGADYLKSISGADLPSVMTSKEALLHPENVGDSVVIIGGGISGSETAEYFSDEVKKIEFLCKDKLIDGELIYRAKEREGAKPRNIDIVEMRKTIAMDMYEDNADIMRIRLKEYGVNIRGNTAVEEITEDGIVLKDMTTGKIYSLKADTIILAAGLKPHEVDTEDLNIPVYSVGDCCKPGKIIDAIYEGLSIGSIL